MNIDYDAIHAEARRLRTEAVNRHLIAPLAALVGRLFRTEPRKPANVFNAMRGW